MSIDKDALLEYVLGNLTPEEEQLVNVHLQSHPEDAAWVRDMLEVTAELAMTLPPEPVPTDAQTALLTRVRGETAVSKTALRQNRSNWFSLIRFVGLAALLLVVAAGIFRAPLTEYRLTQRLARNCVAQNVTCQDINSETGEALGTLVIKPDGLLLVLNQSAPSGQVYQAWEIIEAPASLGTWRGRVFEVDVPLNAAATFGVTLEPPGGSPQPTTTPIIAVPIGTA